MLRIYLLVAVRTLLRHKSYSFINLFGLSIGVACCTLIYLYVDHELRHDAFHEKGERIYRLLLEDGSEKKTGTLFPGAMTHAVSENVAGVSRATAFLRSTARVRWKDSVLDEQIGLVSPDFLEVFSFPLLHGDPAAVMERRDAVVIGRTAAARLFGEHGAALAGVIGRTISVLGRDHIVTGVVEDVPEASSLRFDYLVSYEHRSDFSLDRNYVGETSIFVELEEGTDVRRAEEAMTGLIRTQLLSFIQSGIPASVPPEVLAEVSRQLRAHFTDERLGALCRPPAASFEDAPRPQRREPLRRGGKPDLRLFAVGDGDAGAAGGVHQFHHPVDRRLRPSRAGSRYPQGSGRAAEAFDTAVLGRGTAACTRGGCFRNGCGRHGVACFRRTGREAAVDVSTGRLARSRVPARDAPGDGRSRRVLSGHGDVPASSSSGAEGAGTAGRGPGVSCRACWCSSTAWPSG